MTNDKTFDAWQGATERSKALGAYDHANWRTSDAADDEDAKAFSRAAGGHNPLGCRLVAARHLVQSRMSRSTRSLMLEFPDAEVALRCHPQGVDEPLEQGI